MPSSGPPNSWDAVRFRNTDRAWTPYCSVLSVGQPTVCGMGDNDAHLEWVDRIAEMYGPVIRRQYDPAKQAAMRSNAGAWRRWNSRDEDVSWSLDTYPDGVHRTDIWELASDPSTATKRRRAFVVTLLWGAGKTNRYYGRHAEALAFGDLNDILERSVAAVAHGDLAGGWSAIYRLPGLDFRFFTKWLWVAGVHARLESPPLIFDQQVINGLAKTDWPFHSRRINYKQRWLNYCVDASAVGKRLGVSGEWVEYWLFSGAPAD